MIFDDLKHLKRYQVPRADEILRFISENDCMKLPNGQIDIDGERLFVRVMEYVPKPTSENNFETHKNYADLQYIVCGVELMQAVSSKAISPVSDYDVKGDYQFFKACQEITDLVVGPHEFAVFYPGEAHRAACLYQDHHGLVRKLVFKIKI